MCVHCKYFLRYDYNSNKNSFIKQVSNGIFEIQLVCVQTWDKFGKKVEIFDYPKFRNNDYVIVRTYIIDVDKDSVFSEMKELKNDIKCLEKMGFIVVKGDCANEF